MNSRSEGLFYQKWTKDIGKPNALQSAQAGTAAQMLPEIVANDDKVLGLGQVQVDLHRTPHRSFAG
jgi:hypothetical protein